MDTNIIGTGGGQTTGADRFQPIYCVSDAGWVGTAASGGQSVMPCAGICESLWITQGTGDTVLRTYTVQKNNVDQAITITLASNAHSGSDTAHNFSFAAGDLINIHSSAPGPTVNTADTAWTVQMLTASKTSMLLTNSNSNVSASVTTYIPLQGAGSDATATNVEAVFPTSGTIKNAYVVLNNSTGTGTKTYTVTLVKNGSPTSIVATLTNTTTGNDQFSITGHSVSVAAGDTLYWQCVPSNTPTARIVTIGVEFDPDTDGESVHTFGSSVTASTSVVNVNSLASNAAASYVTAGNIGSRDAYSQFVTWKKLYVKQQTASGGSASYQYQFTLLNTPGNPSVTLSGATVTGNDTTNTIVSAPAFGGIVAMTITPSSSPASTIAEWGIVSATAIPTVPIVTTSAATAINSTGATLNGNLSSTNLSGGSVVVEYGFVWSTTSNPPTTADTKVTSSNVNGVSGNYSATPTGLAPGVTYHVRAYAINGVGTGYGGSVSVDFVTSGSFTPMF